MANRYWVGGTATWDATAGSKWALTSGGAGGQTVPGAADLVYFDAASGASTVTLGTGYNPSVGYVTCTGFTGTLAFGSQNITCNGTSATQFAQSTTMTVTGTPVVNINNTGSGTIAISTAGVSEANAISFNIISGTGTCTIGSSAVCKNLNLTGFAGTFALGTRTIYGNLTIPAGVTVSAGTSITTLAATSGTQQITTNNITLDFPITMSGTATVQLQDNLTIGSSRTFTFTSGTLNLNSKALTVGNWSSVNSNTRAISFGTGSINVANSATSIFSMSTATGFTYTGTPTVNFTYSGSTGTRTITFGSTGGTETNALNFNVTAGSDLVVFSARIKNLNFTGFSGTLSASTIVSFGNYTISSGMSTTSGGGSTTFSATSGTQQITTASKTLDFGLIFDGVGGTFAFQDALTQSSTRAFTITNGTVQLKNATTNTIGTFSTSGSNVKYLQSTSAGNQATISKSSGTIAANYLNIKDIVAAGGAVWSAYTVNNNVNSGNNSGWNFGGNFMPMFA